MISTEVQRTLVKSPPELWAELSDPASLARHLGELGDVRITRTQPERTVEWEAEKTSGTVQIKPSGWGTRVTLTVMRDAPEAGGAADTVLEQPHEPVDGAPAPAAAPEPVDGAPAPATAPEPVDADAGDPPDAPEPVREPDAPAAARATPEIAGESAGDPILQWRPQTAAGAARTHAWRARDAFSSETDAEESAWRPERAFEPATGAAHAAAARLEHDPDTAEELIEAENERFDQEPAASGRLAWVAYETQEPEPRRGFLTRLFGRRRARGAIEPGPAAALPASDAAAGQHAEIAAEQSQPDALDAIAVEPAPDASVSPAQPDTAAALEAPAAAAAEPVAEISAELKAAEEAATAEVTALLTAVLDRLGAAHHRPFSRA